MNRPTFLFTYSHQINIFNQHNPMICHQHQYLVNILFYKAPLIDMQDSVAINILQPPLDLHLFFDSGLFNRFINGIHLDWVCSLRAANIICVKVPVAQRTQTGEGAVCPRAEENVKKHPPLSHFNPVFSQDICAKGYYLKRKKKPVNNYIR